MTERATIFQTVQIGVEVTPGTGVAANKKLQSMSIGPAVKLEVSQFRPMGTKFPTIAVPGKEWVSAPLTGAPTYDEIVYPLCSVLAYAAPVQQGGTAAYKWTLAPSSVAADTVKTYTVEQGSAERAHKFSYGVVNSLGFNFSRAGLEQDGEMLGAALQDGISMTGSPTVIPLVPILPIHVDIKLADTQAGLAGASALTRAISCRWGISDRFGPVFPLATAGGTGFATVVETEPKLEFKLKMEADATGMGLLTTMRAGSTKFARIAAVGGLIASTYYYTFQTDLAFKVTEVSEFTDEDGLFAIEWTGVGVHDSTWGKAIQVDVINTLTGL